MNIPEQWTELLHEVQKQRPFAVIAGGALRDLDHGMEPTDVDIFTHSLPNMEWIMDFEMVDKHKFYFKDGSQGASRVIKGKWRDLDVDIVEMEHAYTPWEILNRFDFGINRIAYDGERVHTSLYYEKDKEAHTATMCVALNKSHAQFLKSKFTDRLLKKYPQFTLLIPERYEKYFA